MLQSNQNAVNSDSHLIVYHVMSFNRLPFIRNLLLSFQLCNVYPNYKWVVADYGSTDGSREFLSDFSKTDSRIEVIYDDEGRHFERLKAFDLAPKTKNQKLAVIGSLFRNEVRNRIRGDLFFDLSDDHQFIRKGDWVRDALSVFAHRAGVVGSDDSTGVVTRAFLHSRHLKKNNAVSSVYTSNEKVDYFVYREKAFDNYCIMKQSTYEKLGPFLEIDQLKDPGQIKAWREDSTYIHFHTEYSQKAAKFGLKRMSMKFPYVVEFPNDVIPKVKSDLKSPFVRLFEEGEMEREFSGLTRPVSSDEIFFVKGICDIQLPVNRFKRNIYIGWKRFANYLKSSYWRPK